MNPLPEVRGALPGDESLTGLATPPQPGSGGGVAVEATPKPSLRERLAPAAARWRYPLTVYAVSRAIYFLIALVDLLRHWHGLGRELANWDGKWYTMLAAFGYPEHVMHTQTTLGFFPLYPGLMWLLAHALFCGYVVAGVIISLISGAVATVLVGRLATDWWGEAAGKRAVLFFVFFPGSIVFSMVYTEGLMISLLAGALLAVQHRRWAVAGLCAAGATLLAPLAYAIVPVLGVVAVLEIRRSGWAAGRRALWAPALAPLGIVGFGAFLWIWTGSPFASYIAQHDGWQEHSSPLALYWVTHHLWMSIRHFTWAHPGINLNDIGGLLGAAFLVYALSLLWRERATVPLPALLWTAGMALLTLTSDQTPPNARMLLSGFPLVLIMARRFEGNSFRWAMVLNVYFLLIMSPLTFIGTSLRP